MKNKIKVLFNILFWGGVLFISLMALLLIIYGSNLPDYKKVATYTPPVATRMYASDGSLLIEYAEERRVFIDFNDIPTQLIEAFVAAEDQNFWHHSGIDVYGIIRASINNFARLLGFNTKLSGASTITQQVAKNFFLTSERTISRKIKEMILALKLERSFSKQHIMTLYLNHIFLGARAYGIGSASLMYFNKPVSQLNLAECAFLASLPKAPNNRSQSIQRRNYVLKRMVEEKYITKEEAIKASQEKLNINNDFLLQMDNDFQYFAEDVRRELLNKIGRDSLYNDGLYIKTTIVPSYQKAVVKALNDFLDKYNENEQDDDKLQGAIIVMNPHTGRVLAMTGGYSFKESSFNRATQASRQIGSSIKPFIYLSALEEGYSPVTLLLDAPIVGIKEDGSYWKPENYDKQFLGNIPLRFSLERSRNVPTVRLVEQVGINKSIETVKKFGIYSNNLKNINLSLALGSGETTLEKLVLGYSAFVNGGYVVNPILIDYIEDRYGRNINGQITKNIEFSEDLEPLKQEKNSEPLADSQSLYQLVSILQGVVENGTGKQARVYGHTIAGKTGTTNEVKDAWFVGFSKNIIAGIYLGYDKPKPLRQNVGSYTAARIFSNFMSEILKNETNQPFAIPDGLTFVRVDRNTGKISSGPNTILEAFKAGQTPNDEGENNESAEQNVVGGVF